MFSCEFCEISENTFFHRTPVSAIYRREVISDFSYLLNFAMAEWFCYVTCFNKVYLILSCKEAYRKSVTQDPKVEPGTQDPKVGP